MIRYLPALLLILGCTESLAPERPAVVAVASSFAPTARQLAAAFETQTGHSITLATGSTGKHFAQIINGAPFDAFLAADTERPQRLEEAGRIQSGTRFTYARGRLTLWSPQPNLVDTNGSVLADDTFKHLAMANPRLAPYGRAAEQLLRRRGQWQALQPRLVQGENIAQALLFVDSGHAELGLVAAAQVGKRDGSHWLVPTTWHDPIEQQAVLLTPQPAARAFLDFLQSNTAQAIIRDAGYQVP